MIAAMNPAEQTIILEFPGVSVLLFVLLSLRQQTCIFAISGQAARAYVNF
ncbi:MULTISPECIES: hypothetical protein [unclassified Paenibacillus]